MVRIDLFPEIVTELKNRLPSGSYIHGFSILEDDSILAEYSRPQSEKCCIARFKNMREIVRKSLNAPLNS